jgi:hypothetical protein
MLGKVLKSPISNAEMKIASQMKCIRCGLMIVKRFEFDSTETVEARCIGCGAQYVVTDEGSNKVRWTPKVHEIGCPTPGCATDIELWEDQIQAGIAWDCEGCGRTNGFQLRIVQKMR